MKNIVMIGNHSYKYKLLQSDNSKVEATKLPPSKSWPGVTPKLGNIDMPAKIMIDR